MVNTAPLTAQELVDQLIIPTNKVRMLAAANAGMAAWRASSTSAADFQFDGYPCEARRTNNKRTRERQLDIWIDDVYLHNFFHGSPELDQERIKSAPRPAYTPPPPPQPVAPASQLSGTAPATAREPARPAPQRQPAYAPPPPPEKPAALPGGETIEALSVRARPWIVFYYGNGRDPFPENAIGDQVAVLWDKLYKPRRGKAEVIEPTRFDDVMAAINAVQKDDHEAASSALEKLSRCADSDLLKVESAFAALKNKSGFKLSVIRTMFDKLSKNNAPAETKEVGQVVVWRGLLMVHGDPPVPYGHIANVTAMLSGDERFFEDGKSIFAFNEFAQVPVLRKSEVRWAARPVMLKNGEAAVSEHDIRGITELVQRENIPASENVVQSAMMRIAFISAYNPVKTFLLDCRASWDGKPRLDFLLPYYAGINSKNDLTHEELRLPTATGPRWTIGAVARTFDPGCKMDTALILEGAQGIGKSTFFRVLTGDDFFTDQISDLGSKDSGLEMLGVLVIELAELDAMGKAEVSRIKRFMTQTFDRFRPPYGRSVARFPRSAVFCGTTNDNAYLRDATGGRRFWTHRSHVLRIAELYGTPSTPRLSEVRAGRCYGAIGRPPGVVAIFARRPSLNRAIAFINELALC